MDFVCLKDAFPNTRFVTMFHGDDYFIGDEKGPGAFALLKQLGDAFLVTTDCFGRATLGRYGFDDQRIVTLRLSIAAKNIPFRERRRTSDTVLLLCVGRLVEKKGLDSACAPWRRSGSQSQFRVEYRITGDGPLRGDLQRIAGEPTRSPRCSSLTLPGQR